MIDTIKFGTLKWTHIVNPTDADLDYLRENYHFHPLDIEDCRSDTNQRPKIDIYDDYYFLILHFPYFDKLNRLLNVREVKIFWGEDFIITIGKTQWVVAEMFREAKENPKYGEEMAIGTSDAILYRILERLMKHTFIILKRIGDEVDTINDNLFNRRAERTIERMSATRKNIILLNTIFKPQLPLFGKFESGAIKGYADSMEEYWSNILDYYKNMWDLTEDYGDLIQGLSQTFDSLQANRTNEIVKILTMISSILLPLTFITGIYGMNFENMPLLRNPDSFWLIIGCMIVLMSSMIAYFKIRKWI